MYLPKSIEPDDLIDLDAIEEEQNLEPAKRILRMAFAVLYYGGEINHSDFITARVPFGFTPRILSKDQHTNTDLALLLARIKFLREGISGLVGAAMMAEDMVGMFTLEEQNEIYRRLVDKNCATLPP